MEIELKIGKIRLKRGNIKKMGYVRAEKQDTKSKVLDIRNALSGWEGFSEGSIKLTEMPCVLP